MKMNKDSRKAASCCCGYSGLGSASLVLFWVVASLVLVTGLVCVLIGSNYTRTSTWVSAITSKQYWVWDGGINDQCTSAENRINKTSTAGSYSSISSEKSEGQEDNLQNKRVGSVHHDVEEAAAASDGFDFSPAAPPELPKESVEIQDPGIYDERHKGVNESMNGYDTLSEIRKDPRKYTKLEKLETGLVKARKAIREVIWNGSQASDKDYIPYGPIYRNPQAFHRSYIEMEKKFKIFIYEEGEPPLFHNGPCKSIYSMEGNFINNLEVESSMRTRNPDKAHAFFLPFSITMMVQFVYLRNSHDFSLIKQTVADYVNVIAQKYPYWNRSLGADHFMLSCHDWGPVTSSYIPYMYKNSIRALCNANTSEGFNPSKDVSFPEINLRSGDTKGCIGGPSPSHRPILAFFAGGMHGPIRPVLLEHWENKDDDIQVHQYLRRGVSYYDMMRKSKYCICPSGYEVASPRIVEALYSGCVPVLISDNYVLPFSDVLNWKSFSVEVPVSRIPDLKKILMGISSRQYIRMQRRGLQVRRHFEVNSPPKRFDVFYMILHSVWLRRLNVLIHD